MRLPLPGSLGREQGCSWAQGGGDAATPFTAAPGLDLGWPGGSAVNAVVGCGVRKSTGTPEMPGLRLLRPSWADPQQLPRREPRSFSLLGLGLPLVVQSHLS